jgi:hypothetical protein
MGVIYIGGFKSKRVFGETELGVSAVVKCGGGKEEVYGRKWGRGREQRVEGKVGKLEMRSGCVGICELIRESARALTELKERLMRKGELRRNYWCLGIVGRKLRRNCASLFARAMS